MKKKVLKGLLVAVLIMTLTLANFVVTGMGVISYAIDVIDTATSHKNVEFSAYFKDAESNMTVVKEESMASTEIKLYMSISVKSEGYFNGEICLASGNFKFKNQNLSELISSIEDNKIVLTQINAGETKEIEVIVEPLKDDSFDLNLLDMESKLQLTGTYKDSTEKDITISSEKNVELKLTSSYENNDGINLSTEILTNKIYSINGENKRIVQLLVNSGLKENQYPIKETTIEVSVPENVENVQVSSRGTLGTNGKSLIDFGSDSWNYSSEDKKVIITLQNQENNGVVSWNKTENDIIIVTYVLPEVTDVSETTINTSSVIELYDNTKLSTNADTSIGDEIDGIVTFENLTSESSIYKGKIYSGEDRTYNTTTKIFVNYSGIENEINLNQEESTYSINNQEIVAKSQYRSTTISKNECINIFGENGKIEILDQNNNVLYTINKNTQADENGNIVLNYENEYEFLKIKTTSPITQGIINIQNEKVIKTQGLSKENIKSIVTLNEKVSGNYDQSEIKNSSKAIELKETITKADLLINRTSLSTMAGTQEMQIEVTLNNNSEQYDLYENPTIRIELPSKIESIVVNSINLLYENELAITKSNLYEESGLKILELSLQGKQTSYRNDELIKGATIIINANVTVNQKTTSSDEKIRLIYTNKNAISYNSESNGVEECNLAIEAPRGVVTVNTIDDITVVGEQNEEEKILPVNSKSETSNVQIEVVNNNENTINNVEILGSFPTRTESETSINTEITSPIEITGIDNSKVEVYYSENENATVDDNSWKTEISDSTNVSSYLIKVKNIDVAEALVANYTVNIPEGLEYNQETSEGYNVTYQNSQTGVNELVKATTVYLTTGVGPKLESSLKAIVGGEEVTENTNVKSGEVIRYITSIKNIGTATATGIKLTGTVPEGTVYVEKNPNLVVEDEYGSYVNTDEEYYIEDSSKQNVETTIDYLNVGQETTFEYEVKVKSGVNDLTINNNVSISYNGINEETSEIKNNISNGDVSLQIISVENNASTIDAGYAYRYVINVQNISNEDKKDVVVDLKLNDTMTINHLMSEDSDIEIDGTTIKIKNLSANTVKEISLEVYVKQVNEVGKQISILAQTTVDGKEYSSNEISNPIQAVILDLEFSSPNENGYVKSGDTIEYQLKITNIGNVDAQKIDIIDYLPNGITLNSIQKDGQYIENNSSNGLSLSVNLAKGQSTEIVIKTIVDTLYGLQAERITNSVELEIEGIELAKSENIFHIIQPVTENENDPENPENPENPDKPGNDDDNQDTDEKYMISGVAWLDSNKDGKRDSDEVLLTNITVKLLDVSTGDIATYNSNQLSTKTNDTGFYIFNNVTKGQYIVIFEYDTSKYIVTKYLAEGIDEARNSNAIMKKIEINGQEGTYGLSDTINIENANISNINIGLIESKIFDLELDKYVSKIIVQNNSGTTSTNFTDSTFAKVEIAAKQLANSTVIIEYQLKITNNGEVDSYVKNVVDYIPSDLKFSSELNKDWYQSGNYLYNASLANSKLAAGESTTLTLTLTKTMTEENTGLINNTAEIMDAYNESGFTDIDSTPGNKMIDEDDMGSADVIIGVKTGAIVMYIGLIIAILALIGVGAYIIEKKVIRPNKINFNI